MALARRGLGNAAVEIAVRGPHNAAAGFLVGLSSIGWHETGERCGRSTEVLAAGVEARTWVGLDISG